jgi:hypothetical protein
MSNIKTIRDVVKKSLESKPHLQKPDISKFQPLTPDKLLETLGITIKRDSENKLATFLCMLSAYTESSQFNISFNAPSSTGKSYIPLEISNLFPKEDLIKLSNVSPTAFYHEQGEYEQETNTMTIDLSRKIIIFLDQPNAQLLQRLRSLFSHDEKIIQAKITDKIQKGGMRTKTVIIIGFPSVVFCSAGLRIDEQEGTRFLLLSPEMSQEKLREGISAAINKEADNDGFKVWLEQKPDRTLLKERICAIKMEGITEINIADSKHIEEKFLKDNKSLKPRHQRDIKRLLGFVKTFALLNVWWRDRKGSVLTTNNEDTTAAFVLWDKLAPSQDLNLPPYILNLFNEIILPAWQEKKDREKDEFSKPEDECGLMLKEIVEKHYTAYGRRLDINKLRREILSMLEVAGLVRMEPDPNDKRRILVYPLVPSNIPNETAPNNSVTDSGVNSGGSITIVAKTTDQK